MASGKTLLVVDDSKIARLMLKNFVADRQPEWSILEAGGVDEALDVVKQHKIDYFSVDLNMPGRDGFELIEALKQSHPACPIVLMTANIQDATHERSRALDITCINKPVTEDSVDQLLKVFA